MGKTIIDNLKILSVVIIVLAIVGNGLYYYNFNVSIRYFVSLSEITSLVANDLVFACVVVLSITLIGRHYNKPIERFASKIFPILHWTKIKKVNREKLKSDKGELEETIDESSVYKDIYTFREVALNADDPTKQTDKMVSIFKKDQNIAVSVYLVATLIGVLVSKTFYVKLIWIDCFLFLFFTMRMSIFFNPKTERTRKRVEAFIFVLTITLFFLNTALSIRDTENGKYFNTKIVTSDSTYISTNSAFYIGQTSNYIFFHNKQDKHTTVIPTSEVKKLELYSK